MVDSMLILPAVVVAVVIAEQVLRKAIAGIKPMFLRDGDLVLSRLCRVIICCRFVRPELVRT